MSEPMIIEVQRGRDGKRYPAALPVDPADAERLRVLVHRLHCADGLSERRVQAALLQDYGIRRSLGRVHTILARWACRRCGDD